MSKSSTSTVNHSATAARSASPAKAAGAPALARSAMTGQFKTLVSSLKPVTRQASISVSQAEKAVKGYLNTASK